MPCPGPWQAARPFLHTGQHRPCCHPAQHPLDDLPGGMDGKGAAASSCARGGGSCQTMRAYKGTADMRALRRSRNGLRADWATPMGRICGARAIAAVIGVAERRIKCAPRDRRVPAALDRDRPGDAPGRRGRRTVGTLALLGAVLGTAVAYAAAIAYSWDNPLDDLSSLSSVPTANLVLILLRMPPTAAVGGRLLARPETPAPAPPP